MTPENRREQRQGKAHAQQAEPSDPPPPPADPGATLALAAEQGSEPAAARNRFGRRASAEAPASDRPARSFGNRLWDELRAMYASRVVRFMVAGSLALLLATMLYSFVTHAPFDAAAASAGNASAECVGGPGDPGLGGRPGGRDCLNGASASRYVDRSYRALHMLPTGTMATAVVFAVLSFMIAVLWAGLSGRRRTGAAGPSDSAGSAPFVTGLAAVLLLSLLLATAAQAIHLAAGSLTASFRGTFDSIPADFWPSLMMEAGRGVLLACFFAALAWGLTVLVRTTTAALAIAFSYAVAFEILLSTQRWWGPYLISQNVTGWLWPRGIDILVQRDASDGGAQERVVHLGAVSTGIYFLVLCAVLLGAAYWASRRLATSAPESAPRASHGGELPEPRSAPARETSSGKVARAPAVPRSRGKA